MGKWLQRLKKNNSNAQERQYQKEQKSTSDTFDTSILTHPKYSESLTNELEILKAKLLACYEVQKSPDYWAFPPKIRQAEIEAITRLKARITEIMAVQPQANLAGVSASTQVDSVRNHPISR